MTRFVSLITLSLLVIASVASCSRNESVPGEKKAENDAFEVRKRFAKGPVTFMVELSAESISTADALTCRMTLDVPEAYESQFPDLLFPDDVPGAILTAYDERKVVENNHELDIREYEIEPEYEGTLKLPALEIYYHRAGEVKEYVLQTEPIEIAVVATAENAEKLDLKPVRGLVTVEQIEALRQRIWPWILGSILAVAAAVILVIYLVRRPRPAPPPRPAHEVALERLRGLADKGLITANQMEPFFVEVTTIVRDYMEQAFGLRAPEQTTEEFLANLVTAPAVARHRNVLEPFLTAADEVKFARVTPENAAMQRAFDTAEDFVVQSAGLGERRK